jgi:hypothetical protein
VEREEEERRHRDYVMRAWLAPLLAGTVRDAGMGQAWANLEAWLDLVREQHGEPEAGHLSLEIALALGFKYAANRRRRHPRQGDEARALLAERTREMLRSTNFWFTRLILIQALCLWHLPDQPSQQGAAPARAPDYRALVRHWGMTATGTEHPFVAEARSLAVSALETGQPERFLWIDESGIVSRIGSRPADPSARRKHNLWIPPSTGWTALHPRAQQLVADVLLLLNLAERGTPRQRERRLQQTKKDFLPSCLAGDRSPLKHTRTTGNTAPSDPGSNCAPGCSFELCPYPPKGGRRYRNELSEAFCRRQQALVSRSSIPSRAAPWQRAPAADLRRFWRQMGEPV